MSSTEPDRERYLSAKREKSCPLPVSKAIGKILFNIRPGWKSVKDNRRGGHKTINYSQLGLIFALYPIECNSQIPIYDLCLNHEFIYEMGPCQHYLIAD